MKNRVIFILIALPTLLLLVACSSNSPTLQAKVDINCTDTNPHPIGESIAVKFEVTYEQVMTWFCSGESFDDILLALQTSELVDQPADLLLQRKNEVGWDQVWSELGLVVETNQ